MDKIFVKKDKEYEEFAKELYEHGALDKVNNLKNYAKEKDDIEY